MGASERFPGGRAKTGAAASWELRPLARGGRIAGSTSLPVRGTDAENEKSGYEAGLARGHAEAARNAQRERAVDLQRLEALLGALQQRFDELSSRGADAVLDLALDVAAQVLRREIQTQPESILPVVREALAMIIASHAHPTVRLAPRDFELVREALAGDGQYHGCRFVADAAVQAGGCRIESPQGEVDATLATRWRRVVQTLGCNPPGPQLPDDAAAPALETETR